MVKHIILWKLRDSIVGAEREQVLLDIKNGLEGLVGIVPGLQNVHVQIANRIDTSNADIMLDCTLEDEQALRAYAIHPAHVEVANTKVRPYTEVRTCLDFAL